MTTNEWIAALQADPTLAAQLDDLTRGVSARDLRQRRSGARIAVAQICSHLTEKAYEIGPGEKNVWLRGVIDLIRKEGKYLDKVIHKEWKPK